MTCLSGAVLFPYCKLIAGWCGVYYCSATIVESPFFFLPQIDDCTSAQPHLFILLRPWVWVITPGSLCVWVFASPSVCVICDEFHLAPVSSVAGWVFPLNNGCNINTAWPCPADLRSGMPFSFFFFPLPPLTKCLHFFFFLFWQDFLRMLLIIFPDMERYVSGPE